MQSLRSMAKRMLFTRAIRHTCFRFSETKPEKPTDTPGAGQAAKPEEAAQQPVEEESFSDFQKELVKTYKVDPVWNMILDLDKNHNLQRELIVHRHEYEKSTYQLRSAILFEDLLKTELNIVLYDTYARPFRWHLFKYFYALLSVGLALWGIDLLIQDDPRNKVLLEKTFYGKLYRWTIYTLSVFLFIRSWGNHMAFKRRFVDRMVYDTQKEEFIITKRNFWGFKRDQRVSRFKLLYTENPYLNKNGTNYYDIDTKEQFMITYKDAWVKQDLFSHLISQRIKL